MIATGRISRTGKSNNATYNIQRRFTDVWVNRTGMWQQVAIHVSSIAASEAPHQSPTSTANEPQSTNGGAASASQLAAGATQPPQMTTPAVTASPLPTP